MAHSAVGGDAVMTCDQCHEREAVVHLTQIVDAEVTTLHLCEQCAAEKGIETPARSRKSPLGSFLAAMGKELEAARGARTAPKPAARCGATLRDFRETGRLGCPDCYRDLRARSCGSCCGGCTAPPITSGSATSRPAPPMPTAPSSCA